MRAKAKPNPLNGKKVWNVLYTCVEADDFQNMTTDLKSFATEKDAETYLKKDFTETLQSVEDNSVYDILSKENYGHRAEIKLGTEDMEDSENSTVECIHEWRVWKNTIGSKR